MNGRNAPLSPPTSIGGNDWARYSPPMDKDGPYPNSRGNIITPPASGGSIGGMNGGFPPGPRSVGGPSPPPSVGRSSAGIGQYARSESGRSVKDEGGEVVLGEHYVVLKRFLGATSQNGQPPAPNKARDKLQRLTAVQFLELSTDVYDELNRRYPPPNSEPPPKYLLPRDNFHPKRNQARQKLSSLPPPRFRDLATDVFTELERRIPRVIGGDIPRVNSPASMRMSSRSNTPINGMNGFPPRSQSRVRRPSEASSIRSAALGSAYGIPPSPGLPPGGFERPLAKQSQSNTIVPNKSTMVEEDDDDDSPLSPRSTSRGDALRLNAQNLPRSGGNEPSSALSDADRRLLDDYEIQVRELKEKLESMQEDIRKKDEQLESIQDDQRRQATVANVDKKAWDDARLDLESQISEAQSLNDRLKQELDRIRDDHDADTRRLQDEIEDLRQNAGNERGGGGDADLERENEELRRTLREQEEVTEEVQRDAQELMREMRTLSQQSGAAWQKQSELEKTIEQLEQEAREWRNRYTRTKTQLRNMRATSMGLAMEQDATKYLRERGFTTENGLVKDVHVTKFQVSVDELLQRARSGEPEKVMEPMKAVVVNVRRIIKDMEDGSNEQQRQQHSRLRGRISSTANNLITAAKNFASGAGISPVSLLDAAASHLVAAVVELLRNVKIRPTPAGELEDDDDDETATPSGSIGFFSPRSQAPTPLTTSTISQNEILPPPPSLQGIVDSRVSIQSSAYSPVTSPRESRDRFGGPVGGRSNGLGIGANMNGGYGPGPNKSLPPAPNGYGSNGNGNGYGMPPPRNSQNEDLKIYLEDQTAVLISDIQELVAAIRSEQGIDRLRDEIGRVANVVDKIVGETDRSGNRNLTQQLQDSRERLLEAGDHGLELANVGNGPGSREWRMWTQTLPPIAFGIARDAKELVQQVDRLVLPNGGADDFS
ncbi:hypothetical protein GGTG_08349 [Gaeumannomyces tritici R3-111a-1]|uniref:GIT Spa2 homology (SHD) domain-containing protein n=1 Tax=Gaeumannomyces tritici (strain R3-111a-1) TaxID=644352 RepID=J3P4B3_GAET3|nr:hypothetical protein GGTG_08349 [Gaeumannomyces tritici R3-111a-1]EJT74509.1 hypothetical protein GGTG_08349 [Gaeumannomyces tritici R3-111a-1]